MMEQTEMDIFSEKKEKLLEQLKRETQKSVCLALSGGVDSSLLAAFDRKMCRRKWDESLWCDL